jgi:hypothetical protein
MHPATHTDGHPGTLAVAVLGTDAVLAGLPATAVQLAHACRKTGYQLVVPASWGDELVAAECLRALDGRTPRPAVMCACPFVRRELLAAGPDLAPMLVPVVPPPVAVARYVHTLFGRDRVRVTYIGACPGGDHPDVDARIDPPEFFRWLAERGITPAEEPKVFDSVLPPDRRRYFSVPGGVPAPEHLWRGTNARSLIELDSDHLLIDLAQQLLSHECALLDVAPALGCACSGVTPGITPRRARAAVVTTEPPRATSAIVDVGVVVELADPIDANTIDRSTILASDTRHYTEQSVGPPMTSLPARIEIGGSPSGHRRSPSAGLRAIRSPIPVARVAGRSLPRAYVAARRRTASDEPHGDPAPASGPERLAPVRGDVSGSEENGRPRGRSKGTPASRQKSETAAQPPAVAASPRQPDRMGDGPLT